MTSTDVFYFFATAVDDEDDDDDIADNRDDLSDIFSDGISSK